MKKLFVLLLISVFAFCGCQNEKPEEPNVERPMMFYNETFWVNPYIPQKELPEGYEHSGTVSKEMAYNTGLEGIEFYTRDGAKDFYTFQLTGTYIGNNTVDSEKLDMHYVQWVPVSEE